MFKSKRIVSLCNNNKQIEIMEDLNTSSLIGKIVYVDKWQYDFSRVTLNGIVTQVEKAKDQFGRLAYKLKTKDSECTLCWITTKELIENGIYKANRMLNSGTNATILEEKYWSK